MATAAEYEAQIRLLDWAGLRKLWKSILDSNSPNDWAAGRAFEYLVLRAFELDGALVRWPYSVEDIEQIDGVVYSDGLVFLVESKDVKKNVPIEPIAKLRNQLLRRPAGTLGLVFSSGGFTDSARFLAQFAPPQSILLWSGGELGYALELEEMRRPLYEKFRLCVEEGIPDFDFRVSYTRK